MIEINKEFDTLLNTLTNEELEILEASILANGIIEPLKVWGNTLIDGHNRYRIANKHGLSYKVEELNFADSYEVKEWMIQNQMGRRNLTEQQKSYLRGLRYENEKLKVGENQHTRGGQNVHPSKTSNKIAKEYNVTAKTIQRDAQFANGVNVLDTIAPDTKSEILSGKSELTKQEVQEFGKVKKQAEREVSSFLKTPEQIEQEINERAEQLAREKLEAIELEKQEQKRARLEHQKKVAQQRSPNALPKDKYNFIYCDPPWRYDFAETKNRDIENHYPTMSIEELKTLQVPAANDCILFMWATAPKLTEALSLIKTWGFDYKTNAVWDKEKIGMGYWFRGQHELLLVATKGNVSPPPADLRRSSVFREPRTTHSKKPNLFYELIINSYPNYKRIELFSRNKIEGFDNWGNEQL